MKAIKKEIVVIILLAILATALSWFWLSTTGSCIPDNGNTICYERSDSRGFPRPYWNQFDGFNSMGFLIDFIFYFVLFQLIWSVLKRIVKK